MTGFNLSLSINQPTNQSVTRVGGAGDLPSRMRPQSLSQISHTCRSLPMV